MEKSSYLLLFLSISIMLGYTYSLDIPGALEVPLRKQPYNFSTDTFNLMYFFTFFAVGVFCIPIGVLIDRLPLKITTYALLLLSFGSNLVIALMFEMLPSFYIPTIMVMRTFFGIAGQGICAIQGSIISLYGQSNYQVIIGFGLAAPYIFDAINQLVTPAVYSATNNLPLPWYIGTGVCIYSLISAFILNKTVFQPHEQQRYNQQHAIQQIPKNDQMIEQQNVQNRQSLQNSQEQNKSCFTEIKSLSAGFWVVVLAIFFFQASLGPVNDNLNELLVERFGISYTNAGRILIIHFMLLPIMAAVMSIFLGAFPKLRRISILVSSIIYSLAHLMIYYLPNTKQPETYHYVFIILFQFIFGVNFAVYYVSLTPAVTYLVNEKVIGTAWGITGSIAGFSQCFMPLVFVQIINSNQQLSISYKNLSISTTLLAVIPVLFSLWIYFRDYQVLDMKLSETANYKNSRQSIYSEVIQQDQKIGNIIQ